MRLIANKMALDIFVKLG